MSLHECFAATCKKKRSQLFCSYALSYAGPLQLIIESEHTGYHKQTTSAYISQSGNEQRPTAFITRITYIPRIFIAS